MSTQFLRWAWLTPWLALPAFGAVQQAPQRHALVETVSQPAPSQAVLDRVHHHANQDRWQRVYTQETDQAFWVRGKTYKASFDAGGATYYPLLGPDKPRLYGFGLGSPSLSVGGEAVALEAAVVPLGTDSEVRYDRGPMTEWYRLGTESIEQGFTLHAPLPAGPLTVAIPVRSELQPESFQGGFLFQNAFGGVHYGAATVLDAAGRSASVPTHWRQGQLQIEVPESFLAEAQWPVTIDPVIATIAVDAWSDDLTKPDIAYDVTHNRVLITYEESAAGADHDIYWTLVNLSDLTISFNGYWDNTTQDWYRPRVANNNFSDSFLVVAERDFGSLKDVGYRIIHANTGIQGNLQGVSSAEFVSNEMPDVGGEVTLSDPSYWLVTWIEDNFAGQRRVRATRINQAGACLFDYRLIYGGAAPANEPAVSHSADTDGAFNLVYTVGSVGSRTIRGATMDWTGTVFYPDHLVANLAGDLANPKVTGNLLSQASQFLVVFEEIQGPGIVDIVGTVCQGGATLFAQNLTDQAGLNLSAVRRNPNVDHDGERFGVVWSEDVGGGNFDVLASTYALAGSNLCESESRVALHNGGQPGAERSPSICSFYGSCGPCGSTYATWSLQETSANIYAAHYQLAPTQCVGRAYCNPAVANSTGLIGRILAIGSHVAGGNPLTLSADQLPPNQFGYFVCGTGVNSLIPPGSQGRLCVGGALGRYNRNASEILNSGASGSFQLSIDTLAMPTNPNQVVMAGQNWYFQAWHRDLNPGQTSNFTRATEVQFD